MELTRQDLDVLIEAVEAWESKDQEKRESARRVRKERSVVLRAKLIGLRDSMDADRVLSDARS